MKKTGLLNQDLSEVIAGMGHTDMLTVCDAGLPIPLGTRRIDLALKKGIPSIRDTLQVIASELQVERMIISSETYSENPAFEQFLRGLFPNVEILAVPHTEFKAMSVGSKAIVRTGECFPYSNVILISGVFGFDQVQ
jgi:D-ribose pyranase